MNNFENAIIIMILALVRIEYRNALINFLSVPLISLPLHSGNELFVNAMLQNVKPKIKIPKSFFIN